eukprot:1651428-Amphidinium_carterae.1
MGSGKVKICCLDFFPDLAAEGDTPKKTAAKKGGVNLKELIGSTTKVQAFASHHACIDPTACAPLSAHLGFARWCT